MRNNPCIQAGNFEEDPEGVELAAAAKNAALAVLQTSDEQIRTDLKEVILRHLIWQITVAHGKYTTKYRSLAVRQDVRHEQLVQHEHVYPIRQMIVDLLAAQGHQERSEILDCAVGCVVTCDEHHRLPDEGARNNLWTRYSNANPPVVVIDTTPIQIVS